MDLFEQTELGPNQESYGLEDFDKVLKLSSLRKKKHSGIVEGFR